MSSPVGRGRGLIARMRTTGSGPSGMRVTLAFVGAFLVGTLVAGLVALGLRRAA